mmetsp:Transcript_4455/g.4917  ORF Transcript_4455/g.4917 Transcript_4455/m.4917 type:complete len:265 (+) Transcript_4455:57-851(+)
MKKEQETNIEEHKGMQQKKNREKMALHRKKIEGIKVDAMIDKLFREPETIASDFISYTLPKYTGNSSPSENQSSDTQITDLNEHRLYSDFFNLPRRPLQQTIGSKSSSKNHQDIQEIMNISRSREFDHQDYELLLRLDQVQESRGLEDHEIKNMRFWQVRKKVKKDETVKNQLDDDDGKTKEDTKIISENSNSGKEGKSDDSDEKELECNICINNIKHGQMARELPCGHVFHKKCIDRWLKDECYCPLDKVNIREMLKYSKKAT